MWAETSKYQAGVPSVGLQEEPGAAFKLPRAEVMMLPLEISLSLLLK
jgi:hypothetical protein